MQLAVEETKQTASSTDFLPLNGTDYVEFWVGNAKQAAYFYRTAFGMETRRLSRPGNPARAIRPRMWSGRARFVL